MLLLGGVHPGVHPVFASREEEAQVEKGEKTALPSDPATAVWGASGCTVSSNVMWPDLDTYIDITNWE